MNFYKLYIGDYSRSTGDLSIAEHGAYHLMLMHFYGSGRPLPADRKALCRLLRAETETDRKAIGEVSLRFWRPLPDDLEALYDLLKLVKGEERAALRVVVQPWGGSGLINARALGEIVKAQVLAEKNRKTAIEREANKRAQAGKERAR